MLPTPFKPLPSTHRPSKRRGRTAAALVGLTALLVSASLAQAAPLQYAWKKGKTYRYQVVSTQDVDMAAMGMKMKTRYKVDSVFALYVDRVGPDGVATGVLAIERFTAVTEDGRKLADISALPKRALTNWVEVAPNGEFRFKELVYLLVPQGGGAAVLARGKVGPGGIGASGSASDGQTKVSVYAEFDPKTGRLAAGYNVKKLRPKPKKVARLRGASRVDVVPFELLSLLRLPDGDVTAGTTATINATGYKIDLKATAVNDKNIQLQSTIVTTGSNENSATVQGPAGGGTVVMPDMGSVPDMGSMPDMGMGGPAPTKGSDMMTLDGQFIMDFNRAKGALAGIVGVLTSSMKMATMAVTTRTDVALKALK